MEWQKMLKISKSSTLRLEAQRSRLLCTCSVAPPEASGFLGGKIEARELPAPPASSTCTYEQEQIRDLRPRVLVGLYIVHTSAYVRA